LGLASALLGCFSFVSEREGEGRREGGREGVGRRGECVCVTEGEGRRRERVV